MSTPVLITDLDPVGTIDPANDLTIVHQGFTDKKATIAQVRNFDISLFSPLPNTAVNNDLFVISRGSTNYQIRFDQVSFAAGTQLWFYQDVAPSGWVTLPPETACLLLRGALPIALGEPFLKEPGSKQGSDSISPKSHLTIISFNRWLLEKTIEAAPTRQLGEREMAVKRLPAIQAAIRLLD